MSDPKSSSAGGGIGITGVLGVVFVVLKLTGHIDWSWWWVTAPFWGPFAFVLAIFTIIAVCVLGVGVVQKLGALL